MIKPKTLRGSGLRVWWFLGVMGKGKALWNSRTLRLGWGIWDLGLKGHHIKVENFEGFGI